MAKCGKDQTYREESCIQYNFESCIGKLEVIAVQIKANIQQRLVALSVYQNPTKLDLVCFLLHALAKLKLPLEWLYFYFYNLSSVMNNRENSSFMIERKHTSGIANSLFHKSTCCPLLKTAKSHVLEVFDYGQPENETSFIPNLLWSLYC